MAFDPSTAQPYNPQPAQPAFDPASARPAPSAAKPKTGLAGIEQAIVDATTGPKALLGQDGAIYSGIHAAVNDGTFGLADKGTAALYHALHNDVPYATALAALKDTDHDAKTNHPVASIAGDIGGAVTGGGLAADGVKLAGAIPRIGKAVTTAAELLSPAAKVEGAGAASNLARMTGNVAKSAAVGGAIGGGTEALQGGDAGQIAESTVAGAVLNPAITKGAGVILNKLQPVVSQSMKILASKLGETPEVLQAAFDNFRAATGSIPPLSAIVGLKSQGQLAELAAGHSLVGEAAMEGAQDFSVAANRALGPRIEAATGTPPQSISDLTQARKATMTSHMNGIRDQPVTLDSSHLDVLQDPRVRAATRDDPDLRRTVNDAVQEIGDNGRSSAMTVNDVDAIRQSLGSRQSAFANPNNSVHNSQTAQAYGAMRDRVTGLVDPNSQVGQAYQTALDQFAQDSHYIKGFQHGMAGKDVSAADTDKLITALSTTHGQAGYQSGLSTRLQNAAGDTLSGTSKTASALTEPGMQQTLAQTFGPGAAADVGAAGAALSRGQAAVNAVAPGRVAADPEGSGIQAGQAAGALASHSPAGTLFHLTRAIPEVFGKLSPKVQETIGRYLNDPRMAQQGINLLKKAGATQQDLRNLAASIGASITSHAATAGTGN